MEACSVTRYGLSPKVGGWDHDGDSQTDQFIGNHDNKLVDGLSCALTVKLADLLAEPLKTSWQGILGRKIGILWEDGTTEVRRYDDTAPGLAGGDVSDFLLDRFCAYKDCPCPETAKVYLI